MATLVLTAVGGIVGGPVGAAIGGLIGNAADQAIFRPAGREGPRLADLSVQTSSYGSPIARVFGTMRVAGSVIWATDLVEHRASEGGGKGQPATTAYNYTASFAVALSGRPILGIARIWADGNLLRGAEGDWKVPTGFRFHPGDEAQDVDPLIAASEGAGLAPAHRGCAYAVFEDLELGDFGNRIPSLTFEVIADSAPVPVGMIAAALTDGLVVGETATTLAGFSAYGEKAASVVTLLGDAAGGWFAPEGEGIELRSGSGTAMTVEDAGFGRDGASRNRTVRPIETVPRDLSLAHYDPARDYQTSVQIARRPGPGYRHARVEMPAALDASAARTMAQAMLARAETARTRRTVMLDLGMLAIAPGDRVTIAGEEGMWRAAQVAIEDGAVTLELVPVSPPTLPAISTSGRVLSAPDRVAGTTLVAAFEIPALDEMLLTQPRLSIAAAGTSAGWRRAALLYSLDNGSSWVSAGSTAAPAIMGTVILPPGDAPATLVDRASEIEIELFHDAMTLMTIDETALDLGGNLALVGGELIQFMRAVQTGPRRWRVTELLRARRGMAVAHGAGERFVLIEAATIATIALPPASVGTSVRVLASGIGDSPAGVETTAPVTGASLAPPSPVHLAGERMDGGAVRVTWVRRSRTGWTWRDGVDTPLGEEREAYRVDVMRGGVMLRSGVVAKPVFTLTADEALTGTMVAIRQLGTSAESTAATWVVTEEIG